MPKRPNIIFIFADEWRGQATGYAGDPNCRTPNLDRFRAEALDFSQAVSGCPVCCPYRASLLTGQYPLTHGVFINDVELDPGCTSIARAFGAGGYRTAYIGKWHVYGSPGGMWERRVSYVPRAYQLGFDEWLGFECNHDYHNSFYFYNEDPTPRRWEGYDAFAQSRAAADFIRAWAGEETPFLLMLSWGPPHFPLETAPPEYQALYRGHEIVLRPNVPAPLREQARAELHGYYAHIAALDDAFETVRRAVVEAGIDGETIFIFTADHGDMRQSQGLDTKLFPWDESVRVPFLARIPALPETQGGETPIPVDAPDILPTLLGLSGLAIPGTVEGTDWSPYLRGEQALRGDEAVLLSIPAEFTEIQYNGMRAYRGLRSREHTYVRTIDGPWLLYDNQADPYQMRNLVGEDAGLVERLDAQLRERLARLGDEFLPGRVYLERTGLSHYREANMPARRNWKDPWRGS